MPKIYYLAAADTILGILLVISELSNKGWIDFEALESDLPTKFVEFAEIFADWVGVIVAAMMILTGILLLGYRVVLR